MIDSTTEKAKIVFSEALNLVEIKVLSANVFKVETFTLDDTFSYWLWKDLSDTLNILDKETEAVIVIAEEGIVFDDVV